jgi:trehalose 6-phosphate phosphatase
MRIKDRQARPGRSALRARGRAPRDLLKNWNEVETKIRNAPKIALFLDFDGTLAPIAPRPEDAEIPAVTRRQLRRVLRSSRVHVTLISGRRRPDLIKRAGIEGPIFLGLYGWEREAGQSGSGAAERTIERAYKLLLPELETVSGVWIENKSLSLAIHFKDASMSDRRKAEARVLRALRALLRRELRIERNLRDWEVLPCACGDKAAGVRRELSRNGTRDALPIYIGDDVSDEAAFRALKQGVTVRVGPPDATSAEYFIQSPEDVGAVLERIATVTR